VPDVPLRSVADVVVLLAQSINETRKGQIDAKIANSVAYLASTLLRALELLGLENLAAEVGELKKQVEDQEARRQAEARVRANGQANGGGTRPLRSWSPQSLAGENGTDGNGDDHADGTGNPDPGTDPDPPAPLFT
jgi:hypothetical protein